MLSTPLPFLVSFVFTLLPTAVVVFLFSPFSSAIRWSHSSFPNSFPLSASTPLMMASFCFASMFLCLPFPFYCTRFLFLVGFNRAFSTWRNVFLSRFPSFYGFSCIFHNVATVCFFLRNPVKVRAIRRSVQLRPAPFSFLVLLFFFHLCPTPDFFLLSSGDFFSFFFSGESSAIFQRSPAQLFLI